MSEQQAWEEWFQRVWSHREDVVYQQLFGNLGGGIRNIPIGMFHHAGVSDVDPRWLVHGVFECPPDGLRAHWVYVTSALSNPWGISPEAASPTGPSGLGFELLIETPEKSTWATGLLHWLMTMNILAASSLVQGECVKPEARIPLHGPIDPAAPSSPVRNLLITTAAHYGSRFNTEAGHVELLHCCGITDAELEWVRDFEAADLQRVLRGSGYYPLTVSDRADVVKPA